MSLANDIPLFALLPQDVLSYLRRFVSQLDLCNLESTCSGLRQTIEAEFKAICDVKEKKRIENKSWALSVVLKTFYLCQRQHGAICRGYWMEGCDFMSLNPLLVALNAPKGVTVHKNWLYWTEERVISRCRLDALPTKDSSKFESLVEGLFGDEITGPNSLEVYDENLYWGNNGSVKNMCRMPLSRLDKSVSESTAPVNPPSATHEVVVTDRGSLGICFVREHNWILWLDWSFDAIKIMKTDGTVLHTSEEIGGSFGIAYDAARKIIYIADGDCEYVLRFLLDDSDPERPTVGDAEKIFDGPVRTLRVFEDYLFVFGQMGMLVAPLADYDQQMTLTPVRLSGETYRSDASKDMKLIVDLHITD